MLFCSPALDDRGTTSFPMEMLTSYRDFFLGAQSYARNCEGELEPCCGAGLNLHWVGVVLNFSFF